MTTTAQPKADKAAASEEFTRKPRSLWTDARRRFWASTVARIGLAITLFLVAVAVISPILISEKSANERDTRNKLLPPSWLMSAEQRAEASREVEWGPLTRPFGTDQIGRDLFRRVLLGAPISLTVGVVAVLLAVVFGSLMGLFAGFFGGVIDAVLMWLTNIMLAFPSILLAIALTAISNNPESFSYKLGDFISSLPVLRTLFDAPLANAMIAVAVVEIPIFARIARAAVLSVRNQEYITAANALGVPQRRLLFRHVLPNSLTPILVQMTLSMASAITSVAALGFLGLGAKPPKPEWGSMLSDARNYVVTGQWWYALFPGIAIMLTVLGFNLLGDGLRDALDPKVKA